MDYFVRQYTTDDYQDVTKVWEKTGIGTPKRGDNNITINNTIEHGGTLLVLIEKNTGRVIGTSWITNDARRLYLHHFGILPEFQSKGLSHILMQKTMEYVKHKKMQIKLEVNHNNTAAINLYKHYGFKPLGDYKVLIVRNT
jgi:ribosomal protein S18 acetylase RimI-like enzyme